MAGDCNVCIGFDSEPAEEFHQFNVTVRRNCKCSECGRVIPAGTLHQKVRMLWEGAWSTTRTCLICAEIRKAFSCDGETIGGVFWDEMEDWAFAEMNTGCLSKLKTPEAKAYLLERWQKAKGLR